MTRPCYLVVDREYAASISTRKLVIETAKLNVVTAYSGAEAIATLERFPAMDGAVIDLAVSDVPGEEVVRRVKEIRPGMPVIAITTPRHEVCAGVDFLLPCFDPARLLEILQSLKPEQTAAMDLHEEKLLDEQS